MAKRNRRAAWQQLQRDDISWRRYLPGLAVIGLVVLARLMGGLQGLELQALDRFLRLRPAEAPDQRLLIVGIDDDDIQQLDSYPVSDGEMAELLRTLEQHQPRTIGVDIFRDRNVPPGEEQLMAALGAMPEVITISKIMGDTVQPPTYAPPEQVGFVDFPLDPDGFVRRAYLGGWPSANYPDADRFRFSLALRLAELYLAEAGLSLENGRRDPTNMRFGDAELPRFQGTTGGYVNRQVAGNQVLINVRSGPQPFDIVSMAAVMSGQVPPEQIRDRIVIIGVRSLSVKDLISSASVDSANPGLVYGVEMQAHVTSQIVSAVLDGRPMLRSWGDGWEYLWIVFWGMAAMGLVRWVPRPSGYVALASGVGLALVGVSWGLLLTGWWIPVVPTLIAFGINGFVLPGFYLYDQMLRSQIQSRQRTIERTYDAIHNGPLQTLALLLQGQDTLDTHTRTQLESLNRELREVYNRLLQDSLPQAEQLQLGAQRVIDLRSPLSEVLYQVYSETLKRDFPGFDSLKFQVTKFEPPISDIGLSPDDKRALCRFLEEALCNVGKHAVGAKRLTVFCQATPTGNRIRIEDNGQALSSLPVASGRGTQQAQALAQRLGGHFYRQLSEGGLVCELSWPAQPAKLRWPW